MPTLARLAGLFPDVVDFLILYQLTYLPSSDPTHDELDHAIQVYKTKLHLQPFPLFNLLDLHDRLVQGAPYLRWAFLALCLSFTSPEFIQGEGPESVQHYSRLGHEVAVRLAAEGTATLEVLQALCLLALSDMKGSYPICRQLQGC